LVLNNQYLLVTAKDTASFQVVVNNAFTTNSSQEKKVLNSIKNREPSFPEDPQSLEKLMLENPNIVLFGPELSVNLKTTQYPCRIASTSRSLFKV
jgi:hypothetical protein